MKAYHLGYLANHPYLSKSVFSEEIERNERIGRAVQKNPNKQKSKVIKNVSKGWLYLEQRVLIL